MVACCCRAQPDRQRVRLQGWHIRLAVALLVQTVATILSSFLVFYAASDLDVLAALRKWCPHAVVAFLELLTQGPKINQVIVQDAGGEDAGNAPMALLWHLHPAIVRLHHNDIEDIVRLHFAPGDGDFRRAGVQVLYHQLVRYSVRMSIRHLLPALICVFLRLVLVERAGVSHADAAAMLHQLGACIRGAHLYSTSALEDQLVAWITMGHWNAPLPRELRPAAAPAPAANAVPLLDAEAAQRGAQQQ